MFNQPLAMLSPLNKRVTQPSGNWDMGNKAMANLLLSDPHDVAESYRGSWEAIFKQTFWIPVRSCAVAVVLLRRHGTAKRFDCLGS